jgi:hypothetical protein
LHFINTLENPLQKLPQVKGGNTAADCEHSLTMFKLEPVNATTKVRVAVKCLTN